MKVLVLGGEPDSFPDGGLGIACRKTVQDLLREGIDVTLVLPRYPGIREEILLRMFGTADNSGDWKRESGRLDFLRFNRGPAAEDSRIPALGLSQQPERTRSGDRNAGLAESAGAGSRLKASG